MNNDKSRAAFYRFLDYLREKGLMNGETARVRKASASAVLSILSEDEAKDVTGLNLADLMVRFNNLKGQKYTPGSLNTYQSRLKSALDDFEAYLANPLAFRPNTQARERKPKVKDEPKTTAAPEPVSEREFVTKNPVFMPSSSIMPIQ